jgi:hypothetical protein
VKEDRRALIRLAAQLAKAWQSGLRELVSHEGIAV